MFDLIARVVEAGAAKMAEAGRTDWPHEIGTTDPAIWLEPSRHSDHEYDIAIPGYMSSVHAFRIHGSEWSPPGTSAPHRFTFANRHGAYPSVDAAVAAAKRILSSDAEHKTWRDRLNPHSLNVVDRVGYHVVATVTRKLVEAFDVEVA